MSLSMFASFWAVSMLLIITPGADWAYAISAGIRGRRVIPAVAGMLSGHIVAAIVVTAGVGSLIAGAPGVLSSLTVAGAGYLLWLGIGVLRHPPVPVPGSITLPNVSTTAVRGVGCCTILSASVRSVRCLLQQRINTALWTS